MPTASDEFSDILGTAQKAYEELTQQGISSSLGTKPISDAAKKAFKEDIKKRALENVELMRLGISSVGAGTGLAEQEEGIIPEELLGVKIPGSVRAASNIVTGVPLAMLGAVGTVASPMAFIDSFFGQIAAEKARKDLEDLRISRGGDLRGPSETEKKWMEDHAEKVRVATGLLAESFFGYKAGKLRYQSLPSKKMSHLIKKGDEIAKSDLNHSYIRSGIPDEPPGILVGQRKKIPEELLVKTEGVKTELEGEIAESVNDAIVKWGFKPEDGQRIFRAVSDGIADGKIVPESWPKIREKIKKLTGYDNPTADIALANEFAAGASGAGKTLNKLSQIRKQLNEYMGDEAKKLLDEIDIPEDSAIENSLRFFRKANDISRGFLTAQIVTTQRNIIDQTKRGFLNAMDDAIEGVLALGSGKNPKVAFSSTFDNAVALAHRIGINTKSQKKLKEVLEAMPIHAEELFHRPVAEMTMGKVTDLLNTFNKAQEYFFRKMAFEARLRTNLRKLGMNFDDMDPDDFTKLSFGKENSPFNSSVSNAVEHALYSTYAWKPKGEETSKFLSFLNSPFMTAFVNPFPRFWLNQAKFLWEHNPYGVLSLFGKSHIQRMASGDFSKAVPAIAKATTGILAMAGAGAIRETQGEIRPWYEIKTDDGKVIDMRAFGAASRYFFLHELAFHPERLSNADIAEGLLPIGRIHGTMLSLADWLRHEGYGVPTWDRLGTGIVDMITGWASRFLTPLGTGQAIISPLSREDRVARNAREYKFFGPILKKIPGANRYLPELRVPYKEGPIIPDSPYRKIIDHFTGIKKRNKTLIESEANRLQIHFRSIYPGSGDRTIDRLIVTEMGPIMEKYIVSETDGLTVTDVLKHKNYKKQSHIVQRELLKGFFQDARTQARKKAREKNPKLFKKYILNKELKKLRVPKIEIDKIINPQRTSAADVPRQATPVSLLQRKQAPVAVPQQIATAAPTAPAAPAAPSVPIGKGLMPNLRTQQLKEYLDTKAAV